LTSFLPLHNRLQPEKRFSETNIISVSILIAIYKDLASAMELVTKFKVNITEKEYERDIRQPSALQLSGEFLGFG